MSGSVTGAGGEPVDVLSKVCGTHDSFGVTGGTRTTAGGSWHFVAEFVGLGTTFRARWKGSLSSPYVVPTPLAPRLAAGGGAFVSS